MTSHRYRGAGVGASALPRTTGLHRLRATEDERRGPDALAHQYACTRDAAARAALVELCEPLVHGLASAYANPALYDDLVQEGFLGLLRAIDRYDPSRGTPFLAFARHFVRGGISHYVRDHRWVLRPPRWASRPIATLSFDSVQDGEPDRGPALVGAGDQRPEAAWDDRVVLVEAIAALSPRQRAVVFYSHFIGLTQADVATRVGTSQKHVSRLLAAALLSLRDVLAHARGA